MHDENCKTWRSAEQARKRQLANSQQHHALPRGGPNYSRHDSRTHNMHLRLAGGGDAGGAVQQQLQQPLVPAWAGHDRRPVLARAPPLHTKVFYSIMRLAPQGWQDACKLKAAQRHLNLTTDSTLAHRDPVSSRHCAEINGRATSWTNNRTGLTGYNACRAHSLVESRRACLCSNRDRQNRSGARMHAHRSAGAAPPAWRRAPRRRRSPAAAAAAGPAPAVP